MCDFYVQPSRYEGKSIAVREAQLLGKPVIITDYSTAHSQIRDEYDGMIVPMNLKDCAMGIRTSICNKDIWPKIRNNLKKNDIANKSEIMKLYKILAEND